MVAASLSTVRPRSAPLLRDSRVRAASYVMASEKIMHAD
jgi:hypothetical protein